jgi:predicted GNAT family acetyltransferase
VSEVEVRDNLARHRFEAEVEGRLAVAIYRLEPGVIILVHTEVPPELGGRGVGSALVRAGLASARGRGLKVVPQCPFFAAWFERHPEDADLLA